MGQIKLRKKILIAELVKPVNVVEDHSNPLGTGRAD